MENKFYIEVISDDIMLEQKNKKRKTYTTGGIATEIMQWVEFDSKLADRIKTQVEKFGKFLGETIIADETELEFSFGITGNGNICILSGSSQLGIKVTMKWKKQ